MSTLHPPRKSGVKMLVPGRDEREDCGLTFLIKQGLCGLLQVPGTRAEGHPGWALLHSHVLQLPQHFVTLRILQEDKMNETIKPAGASALRACQ